MTNRHRIIAALSSAGVGGFIGSILDEFGQIDLAYIFDASSSSVLELTGKTPALTEVGAPEYRGQGIGGGIERVVKYDGGSSYHEAVMPGGTDKSFTIFFLFRPSTGTTQMLAGCGNNSNDYFVLWLTSGFLRARAYVAPSGAIRDTSSPLYACNDDQWHLGALRYDAADDSASVFFNGLGPYDSADFSTGQTANREWRFGDAIPATTGFEGSIAAMLWSNSVMSDADCLAITALVAPPYRRFNNDPILGFAANLRNAWQLLEDYGDTTLLDNKNGYTFNTTGLPALRQEALFPTQERFSIALQGTNGAVCSSATGHNYLTVGTYSIFVSISVDDVTDAERVIVGNSILAGERGMSLLYDAGDLVVWHSDGTTRSEVRAVGVITDTDPHRIVVCAGGGTAEIYLDGTLVATGAIVSGVSGSTNVLQLGQSVGGLNRFDGRIGPMIVTLTKASEVQVARDWEVRRLWKNTLPTIGQVVCSLGDSLVHGLTATTDPTSGNHGGWRPSLFWEMHRRGSSIQIGGTLVAGPYDGVDRHNGYGGQKVLTINGFVGTVAALSPDVLIVIAGTNDILAGDGAATTLTRIQTLMTSIESAMPTTQVIVCGLPSVGGTYAADAVTFNAGLEAAVSGFSNAVALPDLFDSLTLDATNIHPTLASYETVGKRLADAIESL